MKYLLLKSRRFILWIVCFIFLILSVFFGILSAGKFIFNLYCYAKYPSWYLKQGIFRAQWNHYHLQWVVRDVHLIQKNTKNTIFIDEVIINPTLSAWHVILLHPNIVLYQTPFFYRQQISEQQIFQQFIHSFNKKSFFSFLKKKFFFSAKDMQIHFFVQNKNIMSLLHVNFKENNQEIFLDGIFFGFRIKRSVYFHWNKDFLFDLQNNQINNFPLMIISYFINPNLVLINKNSFLNVINRQNDLEFSIKKTQILIHQENDIAEDGVTSFYGVIDLKELSNLLFSFSDNRITSLLKINGRISKNQIFGNMYLSHGVFWARPYFIQPVPVQGDIQFHIDKTKGIDLFGKMHFIHDSTLSFFIKSKDLLFKKQRIIRLLANKILLHDLHIMWPIGLAESARLWVTNNIKYGFVQQATLINETNILGKVTNFFGNIEVNNATVQYFFPLPLARHVFSNIQYNKSGLDIRIQKGFINKINISNSHINLNYHPFLDSFMMHINLNQKGNLKDLINILDKKPLLLIKKLDENKIYKSSGYIDGAIILDFPLINKLHVNDLHVQANGKVKNFLLPIDETKTFYGNDINLNINDGGVLIKGKGVGEGFPITFRWKKNFYNDLTVAEGVIKIPPQINFPIKWKKSFPVSFFYQKRNGELTGHVSADLTSYLIESPMLLWKHLQKSPLLFSLDIEKKRKLRNYFIKWSLLGIKTIVRGYVEADNNEHIITFTIPQLLLPNNNGFFQFYDKKGQYFWNLRIARINFSHWIHDLQNKINTKNNKKNTLMIFGQKRSIFNGFPSFLHVHALIDRIVDENNNLIYRNFLFHWNRDNKYTTLLNISAYDQKKVLCIKGDMNEKFPQHIQIDVCSLSNLLRAGGYSDPVDAGAVKITGIRVNKNAPIEGKIILKNYKISNIPILGNLLHVISVVGLTKANDSSIKFYQMVLPYKLLKNILSVKHGYMYGLSTGLTIDDGYVDFNHNNILFKGGVVPAFFINQAIGIIPVIGYLLTGGHKGGLLTMNYVVRGPIMNPKVYVHPMSVLLPGFLRNWFSPTIKKPEYEK